MANRQELIVEISQEQARLAALKAEVEESCARLVALREQLSAEPPARIVLPTPLALATASAPMTNAAKVAVSRSLFRGRKDVFPRWSGSTRRKALRQTVRSVGPRTSPRRERVMPSPS